MGTLYPCSIKTKEVLRNPSPTPPRDFLRPERFLLGLGPYGSQGISWTSGMDLPIPPKFWWSTDILSSSIFLQGLDQEFLPFGQGRADSAKINPSLLMMRECFFYFCSCLCPWFFLLCHVYDCWQLFVLCLHLLKRVVALFSWNISFIYFQFLFIFSLHCPHLCVCYMYFSTLSIVTARDHCGITWVLFLFSQVSKTFYIWFFLLCGESPSDDTQGNNPKTGRSLRLFHYYW